MTDKRHLVLINLGRIQELIGKGMIDLDKCNRVITLRELYEAGIRDAPDGVKICARQGDRFRERVTIIVNQFSQSAIRIIEELGGNAVAIFYTKDGTFIRSASFIACLDIRRLTRPRLYRFKYPARFQPPKNKRAIMYYSREENRGYLGTKYRAICERSIPHFKQQYIIRRTRLLPTPIISITTAINKD